MLISLRMVPEALSADGNTAVGSGRHNGGNYDVLRWKRGVGLISIGRPQLQTWGEPKALSGDGSVIAVLSGGINQFPDQSWRYTDTTGYTRLMFPGTVGTTATCLSRDGTTFAGAALAGSYFYQAFVWTADQGFRMVPSGGNYATWIRALSPDGNIAVGTGSSAAGTLAALWPSTHLWCVQLGAIPGSTASFATDMTPDGATIVGYSSAPNSSAAFVWNEQTGFVRLDPPPPYAFARLSAVSDDGTIAVGYVNVGLDDEMGVVWRRGMPLIPAHEYLAARGVVTTSPIFEMHDLSANGRVFLGRFGDVWAGNAFIADLGPCGSADFNHDGNSGTDQDIEAFFACLAGHCCPLCDPADFNSDGDTGTDQDIEAFFRVLAGHSC
jgi:uncharacterized membrane protein